MKIKKKKKGGPKGAQDNIAKKLKAKKIGPIELPTRRVGEWERARNSRDSTPGAPKHKKGRAVTAVDDDEVALMVQKKAGGKTFDEIAAEHHLSRTYVERAIRAKYINHGAGREILKGVLLENAIATGVQASKKIEELNGMQSVVASGIMTQRFIDLDKHTQSMPQGTTDFAAIAKLSDTVSSLANSLGLDDIGAPIDIEAEVTRKGDD